MKKTMMVAAVAAMILTGCGTPKLRDIELKGMYVNSATETLAIGQGKLTSIPGDREAMAAHYEEDTAWLSPSTKTHALDIFLVGSNTVGNASQIVESVCKAFAEVAPTIAKVNADAPKGATALDVISPATPSAAASAACEGGDCTDKE